MPHSVGIIGYGSFGSFIHELLKRLAPAVSVKIFSPEKSADNQTFFSREEAAQCDAVVFAVPIRAYETALKVTVPLMKKEGIIIDVATVKVHTVALLKKYRDGRPYIATHPMFGPESYQKRRKDVSGFRIVVTEHTIRSAEYVGLLEFLQTCNFEVIQLSTDEHDKLLAETLFLTHFIGQVVTHAGFVRTDIDTVSFGFLMDAVESVQNDAALFLDVFEYNPYCEKVIRRYEAANNIVLSRLK